MGAEDGGRGGSAGGRGLVKKVEEVVYGMVAVMLAACILQVVKEGVFFLTWAWAAVK